MKVRPAIGDQIIVHVGSPKLSLGILAKDVDALLSAPKGFVEFPQHFYVIDGRLSERNLSAEPLNAYRLVVSVARLFAESAAFMDQLEQKLFYFKDGKLELPVRYTAAILRSVDAVAVERLLMQFTDPLHRVQKLAILADGIVALVKAQPEATRFEYLVRNIDHLAVSLEDGYRLFVSSFSYDKIRSDVENASLDFVSRIHKTFVDTGTGRSERATPAQTLQSFDRPNWLALALKCEGGRNGVRWVKALLCPSRCQRGCQSFRRQWPG